VTEILALSHIKDKWILVLSEFGKWILALSAKVVKG